MAQPSNLAGASHGGSSSLQITEAGASPGITGAPPRSESLEEAQQQVICHASVSEAPAHAQHAHAGGQAFCAVLGVVGAGPPQEIMARLGCARLVLQCSNGKPGHEMASRMQAEAVLDLMKRSAKAILKMGPEARAKVTALVASSAWHPGDMEEIMSRLAPPPGEVAAHHSMHKFTPDILHYFTAA